MFFRRDCGDGWQKGATRKRKMKYVGGLGDKGRIPCLLCKRWMVLVVLVQAWSLPSTTGSLRYTPDTQALCHNTLH